MRNTKLQLIIGIIISAAFLYYALRGVKMSELWAAVVAFKWWWAIPFQVIMWGSLYVRAIRWHYLMKPTANLKSSRLFSPMMAGFGINSIMPGRAGEFARAYVLGVREKLSFASVFATIVVERIFDSLALLVLLIIVLANLRFDPAIFKEYGGYRISGQTLRDMSVTVTKFLSIMLAGCVLLLWPKGRAGVCSLVETVPFAPKAWREKISALIRGFSEGLVSLRDFKTTIIVMVLSGVVWVTQGLSFQVLAFGFEGMRMTLMQGIAITVIACIAIIIPAAPGYWGLQEIGVIFGLTILGVDSNNARMLGYALMMHALQYFPIVFVGLYFMWKEHVSLGEISQKKAVE